MVKSVAELLGSGRYNIIHTQNPFLKQIFLEEAIKTEMPVIYLDFDLLYSGYVGMGVVRPQPNATCLRVYPESLLAILARTAAVISENQCMVVLDSLNGFDSMLGSGRMLISYLMILHTMAVQSRSLLVCPYTAGIAGRQILYPSGTIPQRMGRASMINLRETEGGVVAELLGDGLSAKASVALEYKRLQTPL